MNQNFLEAVDQINRKFIDHMNWGIVTDSESELDSKEHYGTAMKVTIKGAHLYLYAPDVDFFCLTADHFLLKWNEDLNKFTWLFIWKA